MPVIDNIQSGQAEPAGTSIASHNVAQTWLWLFLVITPMIIALIAVIVVEYRKKRKSNNDSTATTNASGDSSNDSAPEQQNNEDKNIRPKSEGLLIFLKSIALVVVVVLAMINFGTCTYVVTTGELPQSCVLVGRDAKNNDVTIDITENLSTFTIDFKVKPNTNIKNLQITCKFYDSSNKLVATKVKDLGNVTKGNQFTFSVSLTISEMLKVSYSTADVTGGTVR